MGYSSGKKSVKVSRARLQTSADSIRVSRRAYSPFSEHFRQFTSIQTRNPKDLYFITCTYFITSTVEDWIDVCTRASYKQKIGDAEGIRTCLEMSAWGEPGLKLKQG